jgi:hypothetical protein
MARHPHPSEEALRVGRELRREGWIREKAALEQERARLASSDNPNEGTRAEIARLDQEIARLALEIEALSPPPPRVPRRRRDALR